MEKKSFFQGTIIGIIIGIVIPFITYLIITPPKETGPKKPEVVTLTTKQLNEIITHVRFEVLWGFLKCNREFLSEREWSERLCFNKWAESFDLKKELRSLE